LKEPSVSLISKIWENDKDKQGNEISLVLEFRGGGSDGFTTEKRNSQELGRGGFFAFAP
jgi:hypothetical protein